MSRLEGKVAIISGAARGMGAEHARRFVAEGALVVLGDLLEEELAAVAGSLGPSAASCPLDVAQAAQWEVVVELALARFGRIDVLVNNAGVFLPAALEGHTAKVMGDHYAVNQLGPLLGILAVWEAIAETGGGSIINITSVDAHNGSAEQLAYAATKWALRGITKCAALELARHGIRVNSLAPGPVITPMAEGVPQAALDRIASMVPLKRFGRMQEIADAAVFLASDDSSFITGVDLLVDGGLSAELWTSIDLADLTFQRTEANAGETG